MKRALPWFLVGLLLGAGLAWWATRHAAEGSVDAIKTLPEAEAQPAADALHPNKAAVALAGLEVEPVAWTTVPVETPAIARVLDPVPLLQQWQDLAVARVAARASQKELLRLQSLFALQQNASARALETGEANQARDEALVRGAEARLIAGWGATLARRPDLGDIVQRLASADLVLVWLEIAPGTPNDEPRAVWFELPEATPPRRAAEWFGPAPTRDPLTQGRSFLALVEADGLVPGTAVDAVLVGANAVRSGARIPASAVVRKDGDPFVYGTRPDGGYVRIPVVLQQPLDGGWLVSTGLNQGQRIVVTGAQILLSQEVLPSMEDPE